MAEKELIPLPASICLALLDSFCHSPPLLMFDIEE